jgi:hypothetical protein
VRWQKESRTPHFVPTPGFCCLWLRNDLQTLRLRANRGHQPPSRSLPNDNIRRAAYGIWYQLTDPETAALAQQLLGATLLNESAFIAAQFGLNEWLCTATGLAVLKTYR